MASNGEDKNQLKKYETEFNNNRIDLKRFAYDVIKYTALKFHVPVSCIAVWEDSDNDYGFNDFFPFLCIEIIRYQITNRFEYHTAFSQHYKSNKLATSKLIGRLLQDVINKATEEPSLTPLHKVEISLSVVCELFLFLYSEDRNLYPKQLATSWLQCYLNINKKQFEMAGGLMELYLQGSRSKVDDMDVFFNTFIEDHCLPYKDTATNPDLKESYYQYVSERNQKAAESLSPKDCEEMKKVLNPMNEIRKRPPMLFNSKSVEVVAVKPPVPIGASGENPSQNTCLGIIPHNEVMIHCYGASVTSSQEPPEEQQWNRSYLSSKERMKMKISSLRGSLLQDFVQPSSDSLEAKQSRGEMPSVLEAKNTPSYKLLRDKPETPMKNGESSALQTDKPSLYSSGEQGLDKPSFYSLGTNRTTEKMPSVLVSKDPNPSCNPLGDIPKTTMKNGTSSALQTGKPSLRSSEEQGLGQTSFDSTGTKESRFIRANVSVAKDAKQSHNLHRAKPKIPLQYGVFSFSQIGVLDLRPSMARLRQLSLDSSGTKQSSEQKCFSALIAKDITPSENSLRSVHKIPAGNANVSFNSNTSVYSVCSSLKQGGGSYILYSSETKK